MACGRNADGQCDIPGLEDGVTYSQVSAGGFHTVLLRSDGRAVACGSKRCGQCNILSFHTAGYVPDASLLYPGIRVIQLVCSRAQDRCMCFAGLALGGGELFSIELHEDALVTSLRGAIATQAADAGHVLKVVLPDGRLLHSLPGSTQVKELAKAEEQQQQQPQDEPPQKTRKLDHHGGMGEDISRRAGGLCHVVTDCPASQ